MPATRRHTFDLRDRTAQNADLFRHPGRRPAVGTPARASYIIALRHRSAYCSLYVLD
jgi:hypothetical protein